MKYTYQICIFLVQGQYEMVIQICIPTLRLVPVTLSFTLQTKKASEKLLTIKGNIITIIGPVQTRKEQQLNNGMDI